MNRIDHIVIAARDLVQGVEFVRQQLGVEIAAGGFHETMATHNCLMQLGDQTYLEVIAINPDARPPDHPRWFALDDALMRASIASSPRLIGWVINCSDLQATKQQAGLDIGKPTLLSRNQLRWEICLNEDGRLLAGGLLPYVLQWHSQPHPSQQMIDPGCRLKNLEIYHNRPHWIRSQLASLDVSRLVTVFEIADNESCYLKATIETASGLVTLVSNP